MIKIIDRRTVFASVKNTDCQSLTFPGICVLPTGRWICSFRAASTKSGTIGQRVLLTWSDNEGKTWSKPVSPFVPPQINGKHGLFRVGYLTTLGGPRVLAVLCWVDHSDPLLPFFSEKTEGLLDSRIFLSKSEDEGITWSEPKLMDTSPFNNPTPITGPVLILPNGEMACQFELNKSYYDTSVWSHSSVMMFSKDDGKSWYEYAIISNDPENRIFYWDQRPGILANGIILDLFWTYNRISANYLNIHARESLNNGRSWSAIWDTGVPGQPAPPISLLDERIAMVYVDRTNIPIIKMRVSQDKGRTWPKDTEVVIYRSETQSQTTDKKDMQDTWAEMSKFSIGLPTTATLQNVDILVVYYVGQQTELTDIQLVRIRTK